MKPFTGKYHLLDVNTWTSLNAEGLEFLVENTFFPPIEIE